MKYFLRTILNVFLWAVIAVMLFLVVSGLCQRLFNKNGYTGLFGIGYAVVVSGSMVPVFQVDDMIVYQKHKIDEYHEGDIVVYVQDRGAESERLITHRIVELGEDTLITRGDANNRADDPIYYHQLVGKVVWNVKKAGKFVTFLKTPLGLISVFLCLALFLGADIFLNVIRAQKKKVPTVQGDEYLRY